MLDSANMGLREWNLGPDFFDSTALAANWAKIDIHDHTATKGVQIPRGGIVDAAIDGTKLADGAVSTIKIAATAITAAELADNAVVTNKLNAASVTKSKLATDALNAFLKLLTAGDRKLAFGGQAINWPGSSILSNPITIAHGLGALPVVHVVYMVDQSGTGYCKTAGGTQSSTQLTAQFETVGGFQPGAGSHGTAGWIAIA